MNTLDELYDQLDPLHDELCKYEEELDDAEYEHELAEADAALSVDGSNEMKRKGQVVQMTKDEIWKLKVAKRKLSAARRRMKMTEWKIDIARSKESSLRGLK